MKRFLVALMSLVWIFAFSLDVQSERLEHPGEIICFDVGYNSVSMVAPVMAADIDAGLYTNSNCFIYDLTKSDYTKIKLNKHFFKISGTEVRCSLKSFITNNYNKRVPGTKIYDIRIRSDG